MLNPKVSIIMSVYNGEKYVAEAIESILNQTYNDFEFIIINDGSTDNTESVIKSFKDSRIRYHRQKNTGLTRSLNKGISKAKGCYIARIDADDYSLPERLALQVELLDNNYEYGLVGSYYTTINCSTNKEKLVTPPLSDEALRDSLVMKGSTFRHSSVMFRVSAVEKVGYYNESYKQGQDYELWVRIAKHYIIAIIPKNLCVARVDNPGSIVYRRNFLYNDYLHLRIKCKAINELSYPKIYYFYALYNFLLGLLYYIMKRITPVFIISFCKKVLQKSKS